MSNALASIATAELLQIPMETIKKGILSGETRGYVYFTLPLFEEYIMEND